MNNIPTEPESQPGGTYSSFIPSVQTREDLFSYFTSMGIPDLVEPDDYHCTLLYSRKACPDIIETDFALPCEAIATGYKILGEDSKVLVLELYCPNASRLHNIFVDEYGGTHDYPEYIAHITIAKDFTGELPIDLPDTDIIFNGSTVEELS